MSDEKNTFFDPFELYLEHEGVLRKSGRYPWGSGNDPYQRNKSFLNYVDELSKKGMSPAEIAKGLSLISPKTEGGKEFTSTDIIALKAIAKTANREADISRAIQLKERGLSNIAIGEKMGINESSVRSLLDPSLRERNLVLKNTADMIKNRIGKDGIVDVGTGVENHLGIAPSKKATAIAMLEEEGYRRYYVPVEQLGTGKQTTTMVLTAPGIGFPEVARRKSEIMPLRAFSEDSGRTFRNIETPVALNPKRVGVRWKEEGGADKDGVIELRRGVKDLSLGDSRYAQVRIQVGDGHYLKGMAMYSDKMPDGVDVVFNTNKAKSDNKLDAMKPLKVDKATNKTDEELPFGSIVRQKTYLDDKGKEKLSPLNVVGTTGSLNEEGRWGEWSKSLSSQMVSKQKPALAKQQLDLAYQAKKQEFDDIMALSNPAVKKKLLQEFSEGADSSAKHLKAAGLPRTRQHVILPINSLKDNEVYAPNYRNGEKVVLVRHPHGGIFEIPELTVNNRNPEANSVIKNAKDAIGINSKVAARLSGADFDGDTVLVIPNDRGSVRTAPALAALKNFDPQSAYKGYEGMPVMKGKQKQMGDVSNLITDMTIKGASQAELARAVKHSMVVIDAEKHKLNYKQSAIDNGIAELKTKYQNGPKSGASTLISKSKSTEFVDERKPRSAANGGPIDLATGKKMWEPTGNTYTVTKESKRTGEITTKVEKRKTKSTKMDEADDAFKLSSGTVMEGVYANHANRLKALSNEARKEAYTIKPRPINNSAKATYAEEVKVLKAKLNVAKQNAPLERQAQLLAGTMVQAKKDANPDMDKDDVKKVRAQALTEARARIGAKKAVIEFTPREWEAIQAGAISTNVLDSILNNANMEQVRTLATPRTRTVMSDAKIRRAKSMLALGYTQAEVADAIGVPTSTLNDAVK